VDYLGGHTPTSWTKLMGKYRPKMAPTLMKLNCDFYAMAMNSGNDPDIYLVKMEYQWMLMEQLESKVTDDQFLLHVINVLPSESSILVTLLGRQIGHKMNLLIIEELQSELNEEYDWTLVKLRVLLK
jgi:gag-polypeptide of LTR copia-type